MLSLIDWSGLSETALDTLQTIALPISLGHSNADIAARLGKSEAWVLKRMRELRDEIRQQIEAGDGH